MKRFLIILLITALVVAPAFAAPGRGQAKKVVIDLDGAADGSMGIGLFGGTPTGITFEMDLSKTSWLDFKATWNYFGSHILLQANYEYAFPGMIVIEKEQFIPFVGFGAFTNLSNGYFGLGVRVPAGIAYRFRNIPLELFLEAGLDVSIIPSFDFGGSGGLGARFRF